MSEQRGRTIEEALDGRAPVLAKLCLRCRSGRRWRHGRKYIWLPQHDAYMRAHYFGLKAFEWSSRITAIFRAGSTISTSTNSFVNPDTDNRSLRSKQSRVAS
jgi:hypothetical protein